uniref:Uncharacterized protein n=1 Tax=Pararge aegeria TaxID=116150 RepID=S4NWR3_9NEOP
MLIRCLLLQFRNIYVISIRFCVFFMYQKYSHKHLYACVTRLDPRQFGNFYFFIVLWSGLLENLMRKQSCGYGSKQQLYNRFYIDLF